MMIKDSYLLASSHTFQLKDMQEITVNIELTKAPLCYHTLLTGSVLHKNIPVIRAVVKIFDCKYNPLFHAMTNSKGVYQFKNILPPGIYKVVAAADGYQTSEALIIKIKESKVIRKSFQLKKSSLFSNGIIYGKIREAVSKKPVEGASMYLKGDCGMVYKTTSNRDGQYIYYNVRPEKYRLIVKKQGYITSNPLELIVDKNDRIMLYIDLQRSCERYNNTISGVFTSGDTRVPDAPAFLYQSGNEGYETIVKLQVTNENGAFVFSDLAEGTYILKGKLQSGDMFEKKITLEIPSKNEEF